MSSPAAWHSDPLKRHELRYWDGERWTEHVSDAGTTGVDPIDGAAAEQEEGAAAAAPPTSSPVPQAPSATGALDQALASATRQAANRIATSALIVGIIGLIFSLIPLIGAVAGFPLGGYAVVGGIIGLLISKKSGQGRGASIAGIVLGALALAVAAFQAIVLGRLAEGFFLDYPFMTGGITIF